MTRAKLLEAAAAKVGRPIHPTTLQYGQLIQEIDRGEKLNDGWMFYSDKHLQQLVAYCKKRAHRVRRQAARSS
jgi:hypothetical protein